MAMDLEKRAKEAFVDDDYELAVDLYTQAIDLDPKNPDLYADRAQANIKLQSFTEAVSDASKAIELDSTISKAYLRKGIFWLCRERNAASSSPHTPVLEFEEYQTAKTALEAGLALAPEDSRFTKLIKECEELIAEETASLLSKSTLRAPAAADPSSKPTSGVASGSGPTPNVENQIKEATNKPKYRHDYYNSSSEVVLTIFAKGVPADYVSVDFGEQILSVVINIPGEDEYHFQPRLFGKIIPDKCRYLVLPTKIEVRLHKAELITWSSLEYCEKKVLPQKINTVSEVKAQKPSYPSSKSKVDWDKLEAQVKKEEKDEKLDGDAALNKFFQDIYADADEDMRRAMSKSFIESNGTVLSTNWREVGSKKVEVSPPDDVELKKGGY